MYSTATMSEDNAGSGRKQSSVGGPTPGQSAVAARPSPCGPTLVMPTLVMPNAFQRRTRLQRRTDITDTSDPLRHVPEKTSITTAVRRKYFKDRQSECECSFGSVYSGSAEAAGWAVYQMEHAWMLSAVRGKYDTLVGFVSEDPHLLTRKDFISGYTVLHWLAKSGQDETLLKLLTLAQTSEAAVDVNVRGSGGLTPLHVACMHAHYMVVKLLVGAFGADVDAMDYNGKRAWQYLKEDAPLEMKELLGTWDEHHSNCTNNNNCSNISEPVISHQIDCDSQQQTHFQRTPATNSWRTSSFRKLVQAFTFLGKNAEH